MAPEPDNRGAMELEEPMLVDRVSEPFLATLVELGGDEELAEKLRTAPPRNPRSDAWIAWKRFLSAIGEKRRLDAIRALSHAIRATIRAVLHPTRNHQ